MHLQQVLVLEPVKYSARENLCWWFVQQCNESPFHLPMLFSDEAGVGTDIIMNVHHSHTPNGVQWYRHQQKTSIFFLISWGGVRLSPLGTSATVWPIVPDPDDR
jgi:hypothetical protein